MSKSALVLFSGGQDSATCLAWALSRYDHVETIGFRYGQKHAAEMDVRKTFLRGLRNPVFPHWYEKLHDDHELALDIPAISALTGSAVERLDGLPTTFVPGRNLLFLTYAGIVAEKRGLKALVGGMCETDYSGYPDCRDDTLKALQATLNLGMNSRLVIETPLMWLTKCETWLLAVKLGGAALRDLILESTHTCYENDREHRHEWGYGCDACAACALRKKGWMEYAYGGRFRGAVEHKPVAYVSLL